MTTNTKDSITPSVLSIGDLMDAIGAVADRRITTRILCKARHYDALCAMIQNRDNAGKDYRPPCDGVTIQIDSTLPHGIAARFFNRHNECINEIPDVNEHLPL